MKKKIKRTILTGKIHIQATYNNTIVTISDLNGKTISWSSSGNADFTGSRKGTPFAAQKAAEEATRKAKDLYGLKRVDVVIKGPGPGREPAVRAVHQNGIRINSIKDITGIPYNGCRPPKRRRV
uniref:Small ribosomal subunit protein uS11c n=1 Tax=Ishige okamurae TaxID=233772 RepID=A0A8E5XRL6_9PHAE|nr:ribosomal protein S11 [Ishige okamurae]QVJ99684.1 ribosomal protein S11 [Ishige okamurae]WAM63980.1 30S ribosomal protein S11 [Ishige okamurae]